MSGHLVLDLEGTRLTPRETEILRHPEIAGLIFFSRNFESPAQMRELCESVKSIRSDLLLCVDQEGGRVQRFREGFTRLPSMASVRLAVANLPEEQANAFVEALGWLMAVELIALGLDLSFAPVLDLDETRSQVIGDRAFSDQAELTCRLASAWIRGMHQAGMAATGKHFPGHGGVSADSHLELPVDRRDLDSLRAKDLIPFIRLLPELDAMMMAHLLYPMVDDQPAGYSQFWIGDLLRNELGYRGVVFSDDLTMLGAAGAGSIEARAEASLKAGCDLLLVCNQPGQAVAVLSWLESQNLEPHRAASSLLAKKAWDDQAIQSDPRYALAKQLVNLCGVGAPV